MRLLPIAKARGIRRNVFDDEPQIVLAGRVRIDTPELRAKARDLILRKFDAACRMFDMKDKIEVE